MKVLVQQSITGLFYGGSQWVADPEQALAFQNTLQAFDFCASHTSCEAQIVLHSPHATASLAIKPRPCLAG